MDNSSKSGARPVIPNPDPGKAEKSFERFYSEHRSLGIVTLRILLGGSGIEPEDIASRMWMKIWERWRKSGPMVEAPKAYVRQCARHAAMDALRTSRDLLVDPDQLEGLPVLWREDGTGGESGPRLSVLGDPDHNTPQAVLNDPRLIAAVQELTTLERLVILIWIETFPPPTSAQIAASLGIPSASTVRGYRMRGLKKLRDIFGTLDDGKEV